MNLRIALPILSAMLLFAGCHSYRVAGSVKDASGAVAQVNGRYRLREIKFDVPIPQHPFYGGPMANPHVPVQVASQMDDTRIREYCEKRWPNIFSTNEDDTALDVIVTGKTPSNSYGWTFFFPYFLSLGILPGGIEVESDARVNVKVDDRHLTSGEVHYTTDRKATAFTPFGAIPFSRECGHSHVEVEEEVSFPFNPKKLEDMSETVFCATFGEAVLKCLHEHERSFGTPSAPSIAPSAAVPAAKPTVANEIKTVPKPNNAKPLYESIENLKKLRADGIITEKEYQDMVLRAVEHSK